MITGRMGAFPVYSFAPKSLSQDGTLNPALLLGRRGWGCRATLFPQGETTCNTGMHPGCPVLLHNVLAAAAFTVHVVRACCGGEAVR